MGKTSFKSLEQITNYISDKINDLNKGQLNNSEIEELTINAQELYERLVVIRHKAYEAFGQPKANISEPVEEIIEIEEQSIEESLQEISPMMSFDFSEPIVEEKEESTTVNEISETFNKEETFETSNPKTEEISSLSESMTRASSLNDTFKQSGSLADRLTNSKIDDLKSAIGINEKFAFITDLFAGSNEDYNAAISILNSCNSSQEAKTILNEISINNNWDLDNPNVGSFIELIERRH